MQSTGSSYRIALGGLIALAAAVGIGRFVYTPILPSMIDALGLSRSAAGLIASANFLGYLLGSLLIAWPDLRRSRHPWLIGALAVSAMTTAGMGLVRTIVPFLLLRFIGGVASAVVLILACSMVLEHLAEARRPRLSALHFAGVGTGIAVSAILVAGLLRVGRPWQWLWFAGGILSSLATIAVAVLLSGRPAPTRHAGGQAGRGTGPGLGWLIAAYGLFGFGYVITATFIVAMVRATPAISAQEPVIWVVFGLAAAPSVAFWTWIGSSSSIPVAFAVACVVEASGVLASVVWSTAAGTVTAAILVGGTFMGVTALGLVRARALVIGDPRRVLALMTAAFGLGQIVGPSFAGAVSDRLGSFTVPSVAAAVALLLAAALALK